MKNPWRNESQCELKLDANQGKKKCLNKDFFKALLNARTLILNVELFNEFFFTLNVIENVR